MLEHVRREQIAILDIGLWEIVMLAGAGFVSGAINAAAGGGSLVSFPALLLAGYPPILANVTNNVAAVPGYAGGAWGYRKELAGQGRRIVPLAAVSAAGGLGGVGLILASSEAAFEDIVPFLVLVATALLALQPFITRLSGGGLRRDRPGVGALVGQGAAAVYGGYFGAALGVAVLALLGLTIDDRLQRLNALKALMQLVIGFVAAVGFALLTPVAWGAALIVGSTSLVGGRTGAFLARQVSDRTLRVGIVVYGIAAAIWLFLR